MAEDWRERRRTRARAERVAAVLELETLRCQLTDPGPLPKVMLDFRKREQMLLYRIEQLDCEISAAEWSDAAEVRRLSAAGPLPGQAALRRIERRLVS